MLEKHLKLLPQVDSFFKVLNPDSVATSTSDTNSTDLPHSQRPSTSTASSTDNVDLKNEGENVAITCPPVSCINIPPLKTQVETIKYVIGNDAGVWNNLSNDDIAFLISKGPSDCQHWNDDGGAFEKSKQIYKNQARYCSAGLFHPIKPNGEKYSRDWLLYSQTSGRVDCFVCKLLSSCTSVLANDGFNDWRNPSSIKRHENSDDHRNASLTYLTRKRGSNLVSQLEEKIKKEQEYWTQVLQRIIGVICTLAERGLPFRVDTETFKSPGNGNFLGLLELIAKFDPFLAEHIKHYGNSGSGKPSYLSKTICDELIELMANKVRKSILDDIRSAGYFSISVDSTPDISHTDQLTVIIRYVSPDDGFPVERFLNFIELKNHSGENLANIVFDYLTKDCEIDFTKCRGQSYDNAANMLGKYNGMQQKILEKNKYAVYIPCAGHSLNLVGRAAVDCCLEAVGFFATIQQTYTFFSASTKRWSGLFSFLSSDATVPKRLFDTRWDAHAKASAAVASNYKQIVEALCDMHDYIDEHGESRRKAGIILEKIEEFEFMFMLVCWNRVLEQFHKTSKALQGDKISLDTCAKLYASLALFLRNIKEEFDTIEREAKEKLPDVTYKQVNQRKRIRKRQINYGNAPDISNTYTARDLFGIKCFIPMVDALENNLGKRSTAYRNVSEKCSFLVDLDISNEQLRKDIQFLADQYPEDIENNDFYGEMKHFHSYIKENYPNHETLSYQNLFKIIIDDRIQNVFPNVDIIFRIF